MTVKSYELRVDNSDEQEVTRCDFRQLGSRVRMTHQGFARIPATLSRVGVLTYKENGRTVREFRPPEEVFSPETLDSMRAAPVVAGHGTLYITPSNYREAIGDTSEALEQRADAVDADVIIKDPEAMDRISKGELKDISPVYRVRIDSTPREWNGIKYDRIQRRIRYNNFALGPSGWGRQGSQVGIRVDAAEFVADTDTGIDDNETKETPMEYEEITIRADGVDYTIQVPKASAAAFKIARLRDAQRLDALVNEKQELEGKLSVVSADLQSAQTRADSLESPEHIQSLVAERTAVISKAASMLDESEMLKVDGMTNSAIRLAVLAKAGHAMPEDADESFINGAFTMLQSTAPQQRIKPNPQPSTEHRADSGDEASLSPTEAAHDRMVRRGRGEKV